MGPYTYSIIIPAFNESARIGPTLEKILAHLQATGWNAEIVVVNDGSRDNTVEIVRSYAAHNPIIRLLENPGNRGKGYSVCHGMLSAKGRLLLFTDADLASPITEADKLFSALDAGADIAIGSRWLDPRLQVKRQPAYRQLLGRIFNLSLRLVLGLGFKDTQCGFKAFTHSAAHSIFPRQQVERWGFDPELLFLAKRSGLRVLEVPVLWEHREGTRLHPFRDGMYMFGDVLRIRWNSLTGRYSAKAEAPTSCV